MGAAVPISRRMMRRAGLRRGLARDVGQDRAGAARLNKDLSDRIVFYAQAWRVTIERTLATDTSVIVHGRRAEQPVVLKVVKEPGDEWRCGEIAAKFGGRGVAHVYEYAEGAALFERLDPGEPLAVLAKSGRDEEATDVLATLLSRMSPLDPPEWCPTVGGLGEGFARYVASGDERVPRALVEPAQRIYADLCRTERNPALLHGDLHHDNVLSDSARGWCAVDPKGVVGELEYEIGAALRNPIDRPDLYAELDVVERRLDQFGLALGIDIGRARGWCFAQAVLAAIWSVAGGQTGASSDAMLVLARVLLDSSAIKADYLD
jgi:streptomycin 6-kinase